MISIKTIMNQNNFFKKNLPIQSLKENQIRVKKLIRKVNGITFPFSIELRYKPSTFKYLNNMNLIQLKYKKYLKKYGDSLEKNKFNKNLKDKEFIT